MTTWDLFDETYRALSSNKIRSGLTILGIVIGISSVIAMVSIGQGTQSAIQASIQSIGSNLIIVSPGTSRGGGFQVSAGRGTARTLTLQDADAVAKNVTQINAVAPEVSGRYQVTSKGKNTNTSIVGTNQSYPTVRNVDIDQGTFVTDQHVRNLAKVAVLGPTTRNDLFGEDAQVVGQTIRIKNVQFQIIGVTKSKGGSGFNNPDDMIFIPISTAGRFLAGDEYVTSISVQAENSEAMPIVQGNITNLLLDRHHISDLTLADFSTLNQQDIVATASTVTNAFTLLLSAVAGISLLVGGIGIMNMMLTSVTERTREIGLRKSIGASRREINLQFLTEAILLTLVGGVIGVLLGCLVSFLVTLTGLVQTQVSLSSILLAFGVSAVIGIVFGYYPARRAAGMNPIDALRYE